MADNYQIQLNNAQSFFLTYDQEKLIEKFNLNADADYLYITMFSSPYRLCRHTGKLERLEAELSLEKEIISHLEPGCAVLFCGGRHMALNLTLRRIFGLTDGEIYDLT